MKIRLLQCYEVLWIHNIDLVFKVCLWLHFRSETFRSLSFLHLFSGIVGFVSNCLVIPVLRSKKMNSVFNHNLIYLAVFDNAYIICSILECIRQYFYHTQIQTVRDEWILREITKLSSISDISQIQTRAGIKIDFSIFSILPYLPSFLNEKGNKIH